MTANDPPMREILVVDDVPEILTYLARAVSRLDGVPVKVTTEEDAWRALNLVTTRKFDLVVSDYRLGVVDGITILNAARQFNPDGHRILMTADGNEITCDRWDAAGLDAFLAKPLETGDVQNLVRALLDDGPASN